MVTIWESTGLASFPESPDSKLIHLPAGIFGEGFVMKEKPELEFGSTLPSPEVSN